MYQSAHLRLPLLMPIEACMQTAFGCSLRMWAEKGLWVWLNLAILTLILWQLFWQSSFPFFLIIQSICCFNGGWVGWNGSVTDWMWLLAHSYLFFLERTDWLSFLQFSIKFIRAQISNSIIRDVTNGLFVIISPAIKCVPTPLICLCLHDFRREDTPYFVQLLHSYYSQGWHASSKWEKYMPLLCDWMMVQNVRDGKMPKNVLIIPTLNS